ncbi:MAG: hypothetical protein ABEJ30_06770 [Halorientalis sp.]
MLGTPLQVVDKFLLQYNVGQALFLFFVLGGLATLPLRSRKVLSLHLAGFGLLFMLTPQSLLARPHWKFFGIALLVLGPVVYMTARE